ncbi:MAG: hypothetical protein RSB43_11555 [Niameybacter sp.]
MSRQANYHLWSERVAAYRSSRLTLKVWCLENNLSKSTMQYWITKLNKEATASHIEWSSVEVSPKDQLTQNEGESGVSLKFRELEITLQKDFHPHTLSNLLDVLQGHA